MSDTGRDRVAVLAANEAFYRAFAAADVDAMDAAWARATPVACIHPGWQALVGRERVMESWRGILTGGNAPAIACHQAHAEVHGDFAYVICYEHVGGGYLVATNLFVREAGEWRMVHHQAGPTTAPARSPEPGPNRGTLH